MGVLIYFSDGGVYVYHFWTDSLTLILKLNRIDEWFTGALFIFLLLELPSCHSSIITVMCNWTCAFFSS